MPLIRKRCQSCGKAFDAKRSTAVYCSTACKVREVRARAAGRPDAVPATRKAAIPAKVRTVTLLIGPDESIEVSPEVAARLAAVLPVPGDPQPWGTDVRPRHLVQREQGIEEALREAREQQDTAPPGDQQPPAADGARPEDDAPHPEPVPAVRQERHSETEELLWQAIHDTHSITAATRAELEVAQRLHTPMGRNAMMLAMRLDYGQRETGSALSSLSREWRATVALALGSGQAAAPADGPTDLRTQLQQAREERERRRADGA